MKKLSTQAAAAAAIKAELKALFPETKFSVTSESFSMGDAVRVHWTDGPATQVVESIIRKYQYGHFDGMTDYYDSDNRREDIPQAKYVDTTRKLSVGFIRKVAEKLATLWDREIVINETKYGGWQVGDGLGPDVRDIEDLIYRELRDQGEAEARAFEEKRAQGEEARKEAEISEEMAWRQKNVPALRKIWNEAEKARKVSLDLGAGQALECREFFSPAEERGLSALADYYDGIGRRTL